MNKLTLSIAALGFSLLISAPARAQHSGPYIGAFLGGTALMNSKSSSDTQGDSRLSYKPAMMEGGVVGWDLEPGNALGEGRLELEYSRRSNSLDKAAFSTGNVPAGGKLTADSLLFNCIGVFRDDVFWAPYLGVGLGAARLKADNLTVTGTPLSNDSAVVFAYQVQAGLDIALAKHFSLDLGYRYFSTARPTFREATGNRTFTLDYVNHSAVLGLRIGF
jgi:opacity protein-like surface antigen